MAGYELYTELKIPTRQTWTFSQTIYDEFCKSTYGGKTIEQGINTLIPTSPSSVTIIRSEYPATDTQVVNLDSTGMFRLEYSFSAVTSGYQTFNYALYYGDTELYSDGIYDYPSPCIKLFFRQNTYSHIASVVMAYNTSRYPAYVDRRTYFSSSEWLQSLYNVLEQLVPTLSWQSVSAIFGKDGVVALSTLNDKNSGNPVTTSDKSKFTLVESSNVLKLVNKTINA